MSLSVKFRNLIFRWESALILVMIAEIAFFGLQNPRFVDPQRMLTAMSDFVYVGIVAMPLAVIMISGAIDISFGSVASLAAITTGVLFKTGLNIWLAAVLGLLIGALAGLLNGAIIVATKVQPMVITLGTQFLFAGLALGASGIGGVSAYEGISGLPASFQQLAGGKVFGVPNLVGIFVIVAIVFAFLVRHTTFGRYNKLFGINPRAAEYAGLRISQIQLAAFVLMGVIAAFAGILLTSYFGSARSDIGAGLLMPTLTLVVIGGVSMYGGEGTIMGVVIATFVIGFLQQGLRFMGYSENQISVAVGAALVIVASLRWWTGSLSERFKNHRVNKREVAATSKT